MGSIRTFSPVKLFIGALVSDSSLIASVHDRLSALYGTIDHESSAIPDRIFFSFANLIEADQLAEIKRRTNEVEEVFRNGGPGGKRPVNLDPGYLENAKVVLASTRNFYHRMYLGRGIFGEVAMHFKDNSYQFFPWTLPGYRSPECQDFFLRLRITYRSQLKTMCILNREEPH